VAHDPNDAPKTPVAEDPTLDSLETRLAAARKAEDERLAQNHAKYPDGAASGLTVISTMVGYPLGGIIIGFAIDNVAGTTPWVTIVLMFTAFAGGLIHAARLAKNRN
jgi:ATP synthase protein I